VISCELREKLEDAGMDEGRASSDEAALHLGGMSNRLSVRVRVPQSRLLSSSINWAPKTEHIFCGFMPRNLWVSLSLQKVNEWQGRKVNEQIYLPAYFNQGGHNVGNCYHSVSLKSFPHTEYRPLSCLYTDLGNQILSPGCGSWRREN
jgi:hypothetical protein